MLPYLQLNKISVETKLNKGNGEKGNHPFSTLDLSPPSSYNCDIYRRLYFDNFSNYTSAQMVTTKAPSKLQIT